MKYLQTYKNAIIMSLIILLIYIVNHSLGNKAVVITVSNLKNMLSILPPIFIMVGLLDVWIPKETMIKYMGNDSGMKGLLIAGFLGSAAAGPLYAAFPIAALLLKKGARFAYVIFFLGAWSTTKLPIVMYEVASLGSKFALTHIAVGTLGFLVSAFVIEKLLSKDTLNEVYKKAESM